MLLNEIDLTGEICHCVAYGPLIYIGYMMDHTYLKEHEEELRATARAIPTIVKCCGKSYSYMQSAQAKLNLNGEIIEYPHMVVIYLQDGVETPTDLLIECGLNVYCGRFNTPDVPSMRIRMRIRNLKSAFKQLNETIKSFFVYAKKIDDKLKEDTK